MFALTVKEICVMDSTMRDMGMPYRDNEMDRYWNRIYSRKYKVLIYYISLTF